jgi:SAM-dependent methyltransferase
VVIVHVLHLVPSWSDVVAEVARALRPGGVLLLSLGTGRSVREDAEHAFWEALGRQRDTPRVPSRLVDAEAAALGLAVAELDEVSGPVQIDVGALVDGYEERFYSSTWELPDEDLREGVAAVRRWVRATYGEERPVVSTTWTLAWRRYSRPG